MGLLSIFKRTSDPAAAPAVVDAGDAVQQARTRARRRLIGAVVLLVIGVIGFPLVFETRPRPVPVDIPIEIPRQDNVPALAMPPPRPTAAAPAPTTAVVPPASAADVITESRAEAGREVASRASDVTASSTPATPAARSAARPAAPTAEAPRKTSSQTPAASPSLAQTAKANAQSPASAPPATAAPLVAEAPRPKAPPDVKTVPETRAPPAAEAGRYVVQVGAFAEAEAARETRQKAEKLGLKTYTQVAQTPAGNRIRVRLGPFANRAEADAALAKARSAGLNAVVLTL